MGGTTPYVWVLDYIIVNKVCCVIHMHAFSLYSWPWLAASGSCLDFPKIMCCCLELWVEETPSASKLLSVRALHHYSSWARNENKHGEFNGGWSFNKSCRYVKTTATPPTKKTRLDLYLMSNLKINSKWIKCPKVRLKTTKLLEANTNKKFHVSGFLWLW